jgi:hypothetical protein
LIIQDAVGIPSLSRAGVKIFDFISSGKID